MSPPSRFCPTLASLLPTIICTSAPQHRSQVVETQLAQNSWISGCYSHRKHFMSFFGTSSQSVPSGGQPGMLFEVSPTSSESHCSTDINARKEAVKASIREEVALANAQELMNVNLLSLCIYDSFLNSYAESEREVFPEMCHKAWILTLRFRRGMSYQTRHECSQHILVQTCLSRCLERYLEACGCITNISSACIDFIAMHKSMLSAKPMLRDSAGSVLTDKTHSRYKFICTSSRASVQTSSV